MNRKISTKIKDVPQLDTRHYEWIFSAAQKHFIEAIERLEDENIRHNIRLNAGAAEYYTSSIEAKKSRVQKIASNENYLEQYREIVEWLALVRGHIMELSAKEFVEAFFASRK